MMTLRNEIEMRSTTMVLASDGTVYTGIAPRRVSLTGGGIPAEYRVNTEAAK